MRRSRDGRPPRRRAAAVTAAAAAVGGVLLALAGCGAAAPRAPAAGDSVDASPHRCGHGWRHLRPGTHTFTLHNTSGTAAEIQLTAPRTGAVLGEAEGIAPGAVRTMRARLGAGTYAFVCFGEDADPVTGPAVRIRGRAGAGPAAVPLTAHDLVPPTLDYQQWVTTRMTRLVQATDALRAAVRAGDIPAARTRWLTAHLAYARLGAAYDAFGDAGEAVDRTTAGLPRGLRDPGFTGFHRVEHGLWHHERPATLLPATDRLARDVRALRTAWAGTRMDPADLGRRAHEILEDTLRAELTGRTDYGSGSGLATARAHVDATRAVLDRLRPFLRTRYPGLPALDRRLGRLARTLDAHARAHHGGWTPPARLGRTERARINAAVGDLTERLASVAALCDVRRTP
ncbi:peptidase M75 family protein [Streptomyces roseoverticillatus]|uniref:EfeM/EfeO family lipoprotein n=1 Tax=Streptomyces roseoverticillatus TaxID=66429 RepID=UPI001F44FFBD|nr:peptidase M75 family protein [Streptomyces roseoverticillatus]MCF3106707.1 peptidase M75 family protein [Streptomyces roseoverticillatus]